MKTLPVILGGLLLMSGCASLSDYHYEHTQHLRARLQYHECGRPECSSYPHDYKKGWLDGFYEVATGGPCCPPAVAPECYWKPGQILKDCDNRRHAYYSGWQDGAARASQFPDTHYLRIFETCECPFPRCLCAQCGAAVGSCGCLSGGCGVPVVHNGMAFDSGAIETDQEIMMMPIPTPEEAAEMKAPAAATTPGRPSQKPATTPSSKADQSAAAKSNRKPAQTQNPKAAVAAEATTAMRYRYAPDNSVTIEFSPSDAAAPLGTDTTTVLSDFDVQMDDVGLIE
ncbi:hypothetical protein [Roseiconus nitratireducens]|uniref:hypothetical protein n=1 Tax=Roseiconus nitratireducens TaxID=2605748 RepID=UPI001F2BAFC8|nr:hypothetical protein [Roseiconus nitratireducens]